MISQSVALKRGYIVLVQFFYTKACFCFSVCLRFGLRHIDHYSFVYNSSFELTVSSCITGGGYVISPIDNGKQSVVKHMLAVDWKSWRSYVKPSLARSITVKMLGRISALRELFRAKHGSFPSSGELSRSARLNQNEESGFGESSSLTECEMYKDPGNEEKDKFPSERSSLVDLNDGVDEFFDVPEPSDNDHLDDNWASDFDSDTYSQVVTNIRDTTLN